MKPITLALLASLLYACLGAVLVVFLDGESACRLGEPCPALPWILLIAVVAFGISTLVQLFVSLAFVPQLRDLAWRRLLLLAAVIAPVNLLLSAGLMVLLESLALEIMDKPVASVVLSSAISCIAALGWVRWHSHRRAVAGSLAAS